VLSLSWRSSQKNSRAPFGCLYWLSWHCIWWNINVLKYLHWDQCQYFLFGCADILYLELISYLNAKSCLDGQCDVLHLKTISCVPSNMFENNFMRISSNMIYNE
jgi:hypothetical protein